MKSIGYSIDKKLLHSHLGEKKYKYRHEIPDIFEKIKELGEDEYLKYQKQRWSCPFCGGTVNFYHYKCSRCGKEVFV